MKVTDQNKTSVASKLELHPLLQRSEARGHIRIYLFWEGPLPAQKMIVLYLAAGPILNKSVPEFASS